jgi:hypothetical protein
VDLPSATLPVGRYDIDPLDVRSVYGVNIFDYFSVPLVNVQFPSLDTANMLCAVFRRLGQGVESCPGLAGVRPRLLEHFTGPFFSSEGLLGMVASGHVETKSFRWSSLETWLTKEYGRRHEKAQVEKYREAAGKLALRKRHRLYGKMFVKDEGYFRSQDMKPRVVMEVAHLADIIPIAPFCNALSDLWHRLDSWHIPPVIWLTGLNRDVVDQWYTKWCRGFPRAIENDFAEFESRISVEALELEFLTYDAFGISPSMRESFNLQKNMSLKGGGVSFHRRGGRMSGVPNTSLGNSILNFTLHTQILEDAGFTAGIDYAMAINGDDNVIFCTIAVFDFCRTQLATEFSRYGMKAEIVAHVDPLEANFCSSRFGSGSDGRWYLACHPFRAICKMGKVPEVGFAGPETIVALLRDYSSTPNFWPLHEFCRHWLRTMGYSFEKAPSLDYPGSRTHFRAWLRTGVDIHSDGTTIVNADDYFLSRCEIEGLLSDHAKPSNFTPAVRPIGLPPTYGKPGWLRKAKAVRDKMLQFLRSSDYYTWQPRDECGGDALYNLTH